MATILVQKSSRLWTTQALHLACALTRGTHSHLVLLHLRRAKNPGLLGTGIGIDALTDAECDDLTEYLLIAEDYGVRFSLQPMEYASLTGALTQAVETLEAGILFADVPEHGHSLWRRFQNWQLRQRLSSLHCHLYTLEQPPRVEDWAPSVSMPAIK